MGCVYLIYDKNNNSYKIGVTKGDPNKRLKKLQTGNSCELEIKNLMTKERRCYFAMTLFVKFFCFGSIVGCTI